MSVKSSLIRFLTDKKWFRMQIILHLKDSIKLKNATQVNMFSLSMDYNFNANNFNLLLII